MRMVGNTPGERLGKGEVEVEVEVEVEGWRMGAWVGCGR